MLVIMSTSTSGTKLDGLLCKLLPAAARVELQRSLPRMALGIGSRLA